MNKYTRCLFNTFSAVRLCPNSTGSFSTDNFDSSVRFIPSPMPLVAAPYNAERFREYKANWCEVTQGLGMHTIVHYEVTDAECEAMKRLPRSLDFELLMYQLYPEHCKPAGEITWDVSAQGAAPVPVAQWRFSPELCAAIKRCQSDVE